MTQYFCPKCDVITLESKDSYMINDKKCPRCSEILKPLPNRNMFNIEVKERQKFKGDIWEIHKYDKDPFPSNPHVHNLNTGEILNLNNGEIHNLKTRQIVRKMNKKDLETLKSKFKILPSISQEQAHLVWFNIK